MVSQFMSEYSQQRLRLRQYRDVNSNEVLSLTKLELSGPIEAQTNHAAGKAWPVRRLMKDQFDAGGISPHEDACSIERRESGDLGTVVMLGKELPARNDDARLLESFPAELAQ